MDTIQIKFKPGATLKSDWETPTKPVGKLLQVFLRGATANVEDIEVTYNGAVIPVETLVGAGHN